MPFCVHKIEPHNQSHMFFIGPVVPLVTMRSKPYTVATAANAEQLTMYLTHVRKSYKHALILDT